MVAEPSHRTLRFPLADLVEQVEAFAQRWPEARADERGERYVAADGSGRLSLPFLAPRGVAGERVGDYLERIEAGWLPERQFVLLLRARGMAMGCWHGDELVQHKAVRKYVVRGSGRAQATHLKTRGKSRYGSRLRLQNWHGLLVETNERIADCERAFGPFDRLFLSVPVRVKSELFAVEPAPPFARDDDRLQRLPLHVHRPDHEELLRVRRWMAQGSVEIVSG